MMGWYRKTGHYDFYPHPFQLTFGTTQPIQFEKGVILKRPMKWLSSFNATRHDLTSHV
jgi:hypothetical protein